MNVKKNLRDDHHVHKSRKAKTHGRARSEPRCRKRLCHSTHPRTCSATRVVLYLDEHMPNTHIRCFQTQVMFLSGTPVATIKGSMALRHAQGHRGESIARTLMAYLSSTVTFSSISHGQVAFAATPVKTGLTGARLWITPNAAHPSSDWMI